MAVTWIKLLSGLLALVKALVKNHLNDQLGLANYSIYTPLKLPYLKLPIFRIHLFDIQYFHPQLADHIHFQTNHTCFTHPHQTLLSEKPLNLSHEIYITPPWNSSKVSRYRMVLA